MDNFEKYTFKCDTYEDGTCVETTAKMTVLKDGINTVFDVFDIVIDFLKACGYAESAIARAAKRYAEEYGNSNM